jgi:hypothetical protein
MFKTRKIGPGMAMAFGLMLTMPMLAGQTAQSGQTPRPARQAKPTGTSAKPMVNKMAPMDTMPSGPDPCVAAMNDIRAAQATVTQLQQLGAEIKARHAQLEAAVTTSSDEGAPLKCPACGMMMPMHATAALSKAVKYGGKTYYCCKGCNMADTADKE